MQKGKGNKHPVRQARAAHAPCQWLVILLALHGQCHCDHVAVHLFASVESRLRNFGVRSGEFCFCKLSVSTFPGQFGATLTQPVTRPSKLG